VTATLGYSVEPVNADRAREVIEWLRRGGDAPEFIDDSYRFVLGTFDDGIVWGRRDGRFILSSEAVPTVSPEPTVERLQDIRVFGMEKELMIWKDGDHDLVGRILADASEPLPPELEPIDGSCIVNGRRRETQIDGEDVQLPDGFTVIADDGGSIQIVPCHCDTADFETTLGDGRTVATWPVRLQLRHHLTIDNNSDGTVRIAATRLRELRTASGGGPHE